jgi:glycerol-3-phosphate acyltransferase PlsY
MLLLSIVVAYLIGSISSSTLISRWFAKIDIREHGSGNAGATNTLRVLGLRWALVVLAADILKGMVAVWIAWWWCPHVPWAPYATGLAAIAGHNWPVFFGFRGGKGVATTIGVMAWLMFVPAALAGIIAIVLIVLTRYVSLGALAFTVLTPLFALVLHFHAMSVVFATVVSLLSLYRHRSNIKRLIRRQEHRIFNK